METKHSTAMVMLKKLHGTPTALGAIDIGLDASQTASPLRGAGEDFYLDIPSHRIGFLGGLLSSSARLCFADQHKNAIKWFWRSMAASPPRSTSTVCQNPWQPKPKNRTST